MVCSYKSSPLPQTRLSVLSSPCFNRYFLPFHLFLPCSFLEVILIGIRLWNWFPKINYFLEFFYS
jgi:hypothetical protein